MDGDIVIGKRPFVNRRWKGPPTIKMFYGDAILHWQNSRKDVYSAEK